MVKRTLENIPVILIIVFIIILGVSAYANVINGDFIWDDNHFIKNNLLIRNPAIWHYIFTSYIGAGSGNPFNYYRPLQEFSYAVDYYFWGLDKRAFHLTNILFHVCAAISIFCMINMLFSNKTLAFLTSVLFVIHPIQTEAVSYLSGRGDPMVALFIILSFIFYFKSLKTDVVFNLTISSLAFMLALFTKENALAYPLFVIVFHLLGKRKASFNHAAALLLPLLFYFAVRLIFVKSTGTLNTHLSHWYTRIPGIFNALFNYVRLLLIPFPLHFDYGQKIFSCFNWTVLSGIALMVCGIVYAFKTRPTEPSVAFGVFWFFIFLLPYSNLYMLFNYMAEHNLYLPSLGFFVIFSRLIILTGEWIKSHMIKYVILSGILTFYLFLTIAQNTYWVNPFAFYLRTIHYNPQSASSYNNIGTLYLENDDLDNAEKYFNLAIKHNIAQKFKTLDGLGIIYAKRGDYSLAEKLLKNSIDMNPEYVVPYNNIGYLYIQMKRYKDAQKYLNISVKLSPLNEKGYYQLGLADYLSGGYDAALTAFGEAVKIDPEDKHAYFHMALIYKREGDAKKASDTLRQAFSDETEYTKAWEEILSIK